jgi:hypothetical protein
MSGVIMALVGEGMRLKSPGGLPGLVSAGEITAGVGLACGLAVVVVVIAGSSERRPQGGRATPRGRVAWGRFVQGHDAAADEWLSPFRPGHTGYVPEAQPLSEVSSQPWGGVEVSPQPDRWALDQADSAASLWPDQPDYPLPDHASRPGPGHPNHLQPDYLADSEPDHLTGPQPYELPHRSDESAPAWQPEYPAQSPSPSEPAASHVEDDPNAGAADGPGVAEDTCPQPAISPHEQHEPGRSAVHGGVQQGAPARGPFEPFEPFDRFAATAEAIGEDALVQHSGELSQLQRQLIKEYFSQAGVGADGMSPTAGGHMQSGA